MKKLIIGTIFLGNLLTLGVILFDGFNNEVTAEQQSNSPSRGVSEIPNINGLSYHDARKKLIDIGWIPLASHYNYNEPDHTYGNGKVFWEMGYWENTGCAGTGAGNCRFEYEDPSRRLLIVITAGLEVPSESIEAHVTRVFLEKNED